MIKGSKISRTDKLREMVLLNRFIAKALMSGRVDYGKATMFGTHAGINHITSFRCPLIQSEVDADTIVTSYPALARDIEDEIDGKDNLYTAAKILSIGFKHIVRQRRLRRVPRPVAKEA